MDRSDTPPLARRAPDARRALILEAARRLFATKGFHETSISDIARAAGVAVGTVYLHFPDKLSVQIGVVNARKEELAAIMDEQRSKATGDLPTRLRAQLKPLLDLMLSGPPVHAPFDRQRLEALGPNAVAAFAAADAAVERFINDLVKAGLARNLARHPAAVMTSGLVMSAVEACRRDEMTKAEAIDHLVDALERWYAP